MQLKDLFSCVPTLCNPMIIQGLGVVPLLADALPNTVDPVLLDEALEAAEVMIHEMSEMGVSTLITGEILLPHLQRLSKLHRCQSKPLVYSPDLIRGEKIVDSSTHVSKGSFHLSLLAIIPDGFTADIAIVGPDIAHEMPVSLVFERHILRDGFQRTSLAHWAEHTLAQFHNAPPASSSLSKERIRTN